MGFFVLLASLLSAGGAASFVGNGDSGGSSETARGEQDQLNENDAAQDTGNGDLLVDPDFGSADDSAEPSAPRTAEASQGDDTLAGTNLADTIFGLGGDDVIDGRGGADSIDGGDGDDVIDAGSGADTIDGGAGDDTLRGNAGDVLLRGQAGDDLLLGEGETPHYWAVQAMTFCAECRAMTASKVMTVMTCSSGTAARTSSTAAMATTSCWAVTRDKIPSRAALETIRY